MLVFSSVRSTESRLPFEATEFTLANYLAVFASSLTYRLLWNTAVFALGSVSIGLFVTIALSWVLERTDVPLRSLWLVLILAPMAFPGIVIGMVWILLANPTNGLLNGILRAVLGGLYQGSMDIYSLPGMIFVSATRLVPSDPKLHPRNPLRGTIRGRHGSGLQAAADQTGRLAIRRPDSAGCVLSGDLGPPLLDPAMVKPPAILQSPEPRGPGPRQPQ